MDALERRHRARIEAWAESHAAWKRAYKKQTDELNTWAVKGLSFSVSSRPLSLWGSFSSSITLWPLKGSAQRLPLTICYCSLPPARLL